jgi:hypothetical protein
MESLGWCWDTLLPKIEFQAKFKGLGIIAPAIRSIKESISVFIF